MKAYLDSSALIKLYVKESRSKFVADYARALARPIPFSLLHEIEIKNGLRLKVFRREANSATAEASVQLIDEDLVSGVLESPELDWTEVFHTALDLSGSHSRTVGCRSLDLFHVACALLLQASEFLTFDDRQAVLVSKAGLKLAST